MKVVCIDTDFTNRLGGSPTLKLEEPLEYGKVYEATFVFFDEDSRSGGMKVNSNPVEWNKNYLNLEGFSEMDWFPTKNFVTLDVWRQKMLKELGI
jgi:hypothetical protein